MIKITANKIIIALLILATIIGVAFAIAAGTIFILVGVGSMLMYEWFWQLAIAVLIVMGALLIFALILFIFNKLNITVINDAAIGTAQKTAKRTTSADFNKQLSKKKKR